MLNPNLSISDIASRAIGVPSTTKERRASSFGARMSTTFRPFLETFPSTKSLIKSPAVAEEAVERNSNLEVTNMRSGEVTLLRN